MWTVDEEGWKKMEVERRTRREEDRNYRRVAEDRRGCLVSTMTDVEEDRNNINPNLRISYLEFTALEVKVE